MPVHVLLGIAKILFTLALAIWPSIYYPDAALQNLLFTKTAEAQPPQRAMFLLPTWFK
jgi:hypothetical protein